MTELDRLRRELAERWLAKHGEDGLRRALGTLRGNVKMIRAKRHKSLEWAQKMEAHLDAARREIGEHAKRPVELCKWLNDHHIHSSQRGRFIPATLDIELYGVADRYAEDLVLECRTKMSARAMSADFSLRGDDQSTLESEAIEKLVPVVALVYRLQGMTVPSESDLREGAKSKVIDIAQSQRESRYDPMLARECFLTDDELDLMAPAFREDDGFWKMVEKMARDIP